MKKVVGMTLFFLIVSLIFVNNSVLEAKTSIAVSSASIILTNKPPIPVITDLRKERLENFLLKYNSPLSDYAENIVDVADSYDIPWTLVTAIAGVESGFCRQMPKETYNCWGWENGVTKFRDFDQAIEIVSRELRDHYFNNGFTTPESMAPVYAPPSTTWAGKIRYFTYRIEQESKLLALPPPLALE